MFPPQGPHVCIVVIPLSYNNVRLKAKKTLNKCGIKMAFWDYKMAFVWHFCRHDLAFYTPRNLATLDGVLYQQLQFGWVRWRWWRQKEPDLLRKELVTCVYLSWCNQLTSSILVFYIFVALKRIKNQGGIPSINRLSIDGWAKSLAGVFWES